MGVVTGGLPWPQIPGPPRPSAASGPVAGDSTPPVDINRMMSSSDSLYDGTTVLDQFTDPISDDLWRLGSSPPVSHQMDVDDDRDLVGAPQTVIQGEQLAKDGGQAYSSDGTDVDESPPLPTHASSPQHQWSPPASHLSFSLPWNSNSASLSPPAMCGISGSKGLTRLQPGCRLGSVRRDRSLGVPAVKSFSSLGSFGSIHLTQKMEPRDLIALIDQAIDNPESVIKRGNFEFQFEEMGLTELPPEIGELQHLVAFSEGQAILGLHMFLSRNLLTWLPRELYDVAQITVLSMRNNQLKEISPLIGQLTFLRELHLGYNELETLPADILTLPLQTLTIHPNPLLMLPVGYSDGSLKTHCIAKSHTSPVFPSLVELCLRELACNDYSEQLQGHATVPGRYSVWMAEASKAYARGKRCSFCRKVYVTEAASTIEWWNVLNQSKVPFRKSYCTPRCWEQDQS